MRGANDRRCVQCWWDAVRSEPHVGFIEVVYNAVRSDPLLATQHPLDLQVVFTGYLSTEHGNDLTRIAEAPLSPILHQPCEIGDTGAAAIRVRSMVEPVNGCRTPALGRHQAVLRERSGSRTGPGNVG